LINQFLEVKKLVKHKYLQKVEVKNQSYYVLTTDALKIITKYDSYFGKAKKKSNTQIMGKDFMNNIKKYREFFPAKKLPSGKPARNNVKVLEAAFRWFFSEYDYTWKEVLHATAQYVNEYEEKEYMYMKTSQYFVAKQDKTKVKYSELADYCDMIKEGLEPEQYFKENVV